MHCIFIADATLLCQIAGGQFLDFSYFVHVHFNIENSALVIILVQKTIEDIILSKPFVVILHTLMCCSIPIYYLFRAVVVNAFCLCYQCIQSCRVSNKAILNENVPFSFA